MTCASIMYMCAFLIGWTFSFPLNQGIFKAYVYNKKDIVSFYMRLKKAHENGKLQRINNLTVSFVNNGREVLYMLRFLYATHLMT